MPTLLRRAGRLIRSSVVASTSLVLAACGAGTSGTADFPASSASAGGVERLVLMGTTDVHGWLLPFDYFTGQVVENGLSRLQPVIDSIRGEHPGRTLLLDSGDMLQGNALNYVYRTLSAGEVHPVIQAMNRLDYDAAALGNHEFNYGVDHLTRTLEDADFPMMSANAFSAGTDDHAFTPYTIVERQLGGRWISIGITAVTPPGVMIWDRDNVRGRLEFREIVSSVRPIVETLRQEGADLVIIASHGGLEGSSYDVAASGVPPENEAARLASEIPGIDVIFLGHTHRELADTTIAGTLVLQARNWAASLAVAELDVRPTPGGWEVVSKRGLIRRPRQGPMEGALVEELASAHGRAREYVDRVIGTSARAYDSRAARVQDTAILDFVNEVQRRVTGAELSGTGAFSLNSVIPAGDITVADFAGLYIYDNTLFAIRISGEQLKQYIEKSAEYYLPCTGGQCERIVNPEVPGYNFDVVSGVDYALDLSQPVGSRVVRLERNGRAVAATDSFTIALNNYRASGAGGFSMLANAPIVYNRGEEIRQLLIDEIRARGGFDAGRYFQQNWEVIPPALAQKALAEQAPHPSPAPPQTAVPGRKRLRVLGTNDFHGTLRATVPEWAEGRRVGGAATVAAYVQRAREAVDAPTILLDGGDVMQGTPLSNLTYGRSSVAFYNELGVTAAAFGNHEFDWGADTLAARVRQAEFAWLGANIRVAGTDTLPSWGRATHMVTLPGCGAGAPACDSVRVGIIGITTTETPTAAMPSHVAPFDFRDEAVTINQWVPRLRAAGADFVIVTAHEGAYCNLSPTEDCNGPMLDITARLTHPPDLIVSGHSHTVLNFSPNGVPVVQSGAYGARLTVVDLERVSPDSVSVLQVTQSVNFVDHVTPDAEIDAMVEAYADEIGPILDRVVATLPAPLTRDGNEYPLGNLIADAQRNVAGTQVAIMNNGGIRTALPAGEIRYEELFRVQPFGNTLVTMDLSGQQLLQALEHTVRGGRPGAHISGVRVRFDPTREAGNRILSATLENGEGIRPERTYKVAVNNFMAEGGDGFAMLLQGRDIDMTGKVDLDALIDYLASLPRPTPIPGIGRYTSIAPAP